LAWVAAVVVLVVRLGRVEGAQGLDLGYYRCTPDAFGLEIGDGCRRVRVLPFVVVQDDRAILGAHVGALAIRCCRVVYGEEHAQQVAV
jgi:hypothetical protein